MAQPSTAAAENWYSPSSPASHSRLVANAGVVSSATEMDEFDRQFEEETGC